VALANVVFFSQDFNKSLVSRLLSFRYSNNSSKFFMPHSEEFFAQIVIISRAEKLRIFGVEDHCCLRNPSPKYFLSFN
jgi:hypothetical protein